MTRPLTPPQAEVALRTLGGLELPGRPFARPKPLLLLAYLALEGPKDKRFLGELFFPGSDDRSGSLRQTLARLRRAGTGVIESDLQRVWTPLCSDAAAFLRLLEARDLEGAAGLYEGAFLSGVVLPELGVELEEWVYGTREFLAGARRGALLTLAEEASSLGDIGNATRYAERAYLTEGAAELEPEAFGPLYGLLSAGNSPYAPALRREAEGFELTLSAPERAAPKPADRSPGKPPPAPAERSLLPPGHGGPFVGREVEQRELAELLTRPEVRLLTLLGPGGVGKTRLALEVVAALRERFAGGVLVAALETLASPDGLPEALSGALGLRPEGEGDPLARVAHALGEKRALLVLDNFEQLLGATPTLERLLTSCPNLTLLVTSRERLGTEAQWSYPLEGLAVPPADASLADALTFGAVQLFVKQAKRSRLSFSLTPADLPFVLQICRRVQGSPLGLELAAGWVKLLPCREIAEELGRDLGFLASGRRDVAPRHGSVRAVFEGSWNRLSDAERSVLKRLSVFRGGFTRQAASEVAGGALPVLASLVDKSLLRVSAYGRYDRHTLVGAYTQEKLAEDARQEAETRGRHGAYFLTLAEAAEHGLKTDRQKAWLEQLEAEFDNLRTAFEQFAAHEATVPQALRLASALHHFWWFRHAREGQAWLERALEHAPDRQPPETQLAAAQPAAARAKACYVAGEAWYLQGDRGRAAARLGESLALYRHIGDRAGAARVRGSLANLKLEAGDAETAERYLRESLATLREHGDDWAVAETLHHLGHVAARRGEFAAARALHEEGLARFLALGDGFSASVLLMYLSRVALEGRDYGAAENYIAQSLELQNRLGDDKVNINLAYSYDVLGTVAAAAGDDALARAHYRKSLELRHTLGYRSGVLNSLARLASLAFRTGDAEHAALLWGGAEAARQTPAAGLTPPRYLQELAGAKARLGEARFAAAWARGRQLGLEQAVAAALGTEMKA